MHVSQIYPKFSKHTYCSDLIKFKSLAIEKYTNVPKVNPQRSNHLPLKLIAIALGIFTLTYFTQKVEADDKHHYSVLEEPDVLLHGIFANTVKLQLIIDFGILSYDKREERNISPGSPGTYPTKYIIRI